MDFKYNVGDRLMMTEEQGGYDFKGYPVTGFVTVIGRLINTHGQCVYKCNVDGFEEYALSFYEHELTDTIEIKEEDIVLIKGDESDYTSSIDGKKGIVVEVRDRVCRVAIVHEHEVEVWFCWKKNLKVL